MRLFFELAKRSFNRQLTYRAATIAGLVTNFFFGLLRAAVLVALYGERQEVAGIDIPMAITYTALTQAVIGYLSLFRWHNLMQSVYSGEVASDLLKPMNYFSFWLAQDMGRAIASFITRSLTVMVAYAIFVGITTPKTLNQWVAVGLALIFSWLLSFSWRFLVNLAAFWTPNAVGIARFSFIAAWFLSGFIMPLRHRTRWESHGFLLSHVGFCQVLSCLCVFSQIGRCVFFISPLFPT
jgi:ABC-2 type transport system permease protein